MTPDELRTIRKKLGMTQHTLADALRMGAWGFQSVSDWEKGKRPIPGPVQVAIELMLERAEYVELPRLTLGKQEKG